MMYIKLLVLIGFHLHFPLISGIYKLHLIKASLHTFQLSPCFITFIMVIHFTLTSIKNWIYFILTKLFILSLLANIDKKGSNIKNNSFTLRGKRCYFFKSLEKLLCKTLKKYFHYSLSNFLVVNVCMLRNLMWKCHYLEEKMFFLLSIPFFY